MNKTPIIIRAFRAIDEPETCQRFYDGHINVLRSYGIEPISSAKNGWFTNPAVYGIIAERDDVVLGGVKIHKVGGTQPLPVEESIGYLDSRIYTVIKKYESKGAGEACGLWNAREVAGWGLSMVLMNAVVSIAPQINITYLFGLTSDHTLGLFRKYGYRIIRSLGKKGNFVYPTPEYLARVIKMNSKTLSAASPYNREIIFDLRKNPNQKRDELFKIGKANVQYVLELRSIF